MHRACLSAMLRCAHIHGRPLRAIGNLAMHGEERLGMPPSSFGLPAQHPGQLGDALLWVEQGNLGESSARPNLLGDQIMRQPLGGHGSQMGDADYLDRKSVV